MFRSISLCLSICLSSAVFAAEVPPAMTDYVQTTLKPLAADPRIATAIRQQNAQHATLTQAEIDAKDTAWRAEVGTGSTPMIDAVIGAPLSDLLKEKVAGSEGRITEAFVMDNKGLNVASSAVTSDYWQGDEAKFIKTFGMGAGAIFVDEVELDESTQRYQGQVSFSITDPVSGTTIGAITFGLDADAFF